MHRGKKEAFGWYRKKKYRNPKIEERKHMDTGPHAYFPPKFL